MQNNRSRTLDLRSAVGQTMTEYGVLLAVIVLVVVVGAALFGQNLAGVWNDLTNTLPNG